MVKIRKIIVWGITLMVTLISTTKAAEIIVSPAYYSIFSVESGNTQKLNIEVNSDKSGTLLIEECRVKRIAEDNIPQVEFTDPALEISDKEIKFTPQVVTNVSFRLKFNYQLAENEYPCISITEKFSNNSEQLSVTPGMIVPIFIQPYNVDDKLDISIKLDKEGLVTSPKIQLSGTLINQGTTYYSVSGTISIFKDGKKLFEKEISSQLEGNMFPKEIKNFSINWINENGGFDSIGDYVIQTTINTSNTNKAITNIITFTYIPFDFILIGGISIFVIIAILIGLVILKKR